MQGSDHFLTFPGRQIWQGGVIQLFVVLSGNVAARAIPTKTRPGSIFGRAARYSQYLTAGIYDDGPGRANPTPFLGQVPFSSCNVMMLWYGFLRTPFCRWRSLAIIFVDRFRRCKTHFKTMSYLLRIMWSTISKPFQAYFALFNLKKTSLVQNHKNSSVRTWLAGKFRDFTAMFDETGG